MVIFDVLTLLLPAWLLGQALDDASSPEALVAEVQGLSPQELRNATALSGLGGGFGGKMRGARSGGLLPFPYLGSLSKGEGKSGNSSVSSRKRPKVEKGFAPLSFDDERPQGPRRRLGFEGLSIAPSKAAPSSFECPAVGAHPGAYEHPISRGIPSYVNDFRQRLEEAELDPQLLEELRKELQEKIEKAPPAVQQPKIEQPKVEEPEVQQPEIQQPEIQEANPAQPRLEEVKVQEPEVEQPEVQEAKIEPPKIEQLEVQQPEVEQLEVQQPEVQQPEVQEANPAQPRLEEVKVQEPEVEQPEIQEPKIEQPKIEQPEVEQPEVEDSIKTPPPPPPFPMMGPPPPPLPKFLLGEGRRPLKPHGDLLKAREGLDGALVAGMDNLQAELQGRILKFRERLDAKAALEVALDEEESPVFDKAEMERRMVALRGPVEPKPVWYQGRYVAPSDPAYGAALEAQNARIAAELQAGAARKGPKANAAPLDERQQKIRDRIFKGVREGGAPMALADLLKGAKGKGLKAAQGNHANPQENEGDKAKDEFIQEILAKAKAMRERRRSLGHGISHQDEER